MMPIGLLMIEHRLIERVVGRMKAELARMSDQKRVDAAFIELALDFFKTYADRCHHGKEEDILFRELAGKALSDGHRKTMDELAEEHVYGRGLVAQLMLDKERCVKGDPAGLKGAMDRVKALTEYYPRHIEKEDKHFFIPAMEYLSKPEQDAMIRAFGEFDAKLIHERYTAIAAAMESKGRSRAHGDGDA